jgi:MFS family permease
MSVAVIAGAVGQWPLGRLSDRMDRRVVIIGCCVGGAAAGLALTWAGWMAPRLLLPLAFGFGLFACPLYALCVAHTNDFIAADAFVETSSGLLLANGLGSANGPLAASALMRTLGPSGLFLFSAGVHAAMALFAAYRMRRRKAAAADHSGTFVATPETVPTLTTLDPRLEGEEDPAAPPP